MPDRIPVQKTYKLVIGGQFPRTESGRYLEVRRDGRLIANVCRASRKDARDAVVAARKAFPEWSGRTAYNRGQILYRMAEVLEQRRAEFLHELVLLGGAEQEAEREVTASIDRLIWYAGWADKLTAHFGSVNPVAMPYFNFTVPEPTGVVVLVAPAAPALLGLISLVAPAIVAGNTVVCVASEEAPLPAVTWGEVLATSDLPGGVVNILTGLQPELLPPLAAHMDVNALVYAGGDPQLAAKAQVEGAANVKRVSVRTLEPGEYFTRQAQGPEWIEDALELKTAWHPMGV
ncbi:MAG TPA: aldehyde dehydrogenase family protein [bacterium]|nr:aldehyde dehydrogenase family protein [bacterium]